MKRKFLIIYFIGWSLTACSDGPKLPRLAGDAVLVAFGDSLTFGNGADVTQSYPAVLQGLSGRKVINAGVSGELSGEGLKRLPGILTAHRPQLLILCHGGNDIIRKKNKAGMESNVREMIRLAQQQDIPVVLLGVPGFGLFLSSMPVYRVIAESMDIVFIEDLVPDVLSDKSLKSDTVHPNKDGYRKMAEEIYAVLQETGAL